MNLRSVRISHFRSIEKVGLVNCGGFNVLIGKNNSGKSNILSAISAFFRCLGSGEVALLDPPIGRTIDFFKSDATKPIQIACVFALNLADRDALIQSIIAEAPQMKNAVEGLDPQLHLSVVVSVVHLPTPFAYVQNISLTKTSSTGGAPTEHTLCKVGQEAASELFARSTQLADTRKELRILRQFRERFESTDWEHFREQVRPTRRPREPIAPIGFLIRHFVGDERISNELEENIAEMLREDTYADSRRRLDSEIEAVNEKLSSAGSGPLSSNVDTFSGQASTIPVYAIELLKKLSEIKVHYLRDRRKEIGRAEAQHLLSLKVRRGGEEALHNIQETVSALLGVKLDAFEGSGTSREAELDVDNFLVEVNGSGIREALRLVLDVEFEQPNVILVEEPEMHLHPALETSMMRYLKRISETSQVFLTTHSTNFLDTAEMKNVYLVSKQEATTVQMLDFEGCNRSPAMKFCGIGRG